MEDENTKDFIITAISSQYLCFGLKCFEYIKEMKYEVDKRYYINDDCIKRILLARDNNEDKALEVWKKWIDWRIKFKPDQIPEESIINELKTGKAYLHGFDREERPCIIIKNALHFPEMSDFEEIFRFGIFMIEKAIRIADEKKFKNIVCIIDRENSSLKNVDQRMIYKVELTQMMQDFYSERVHKIYILHVNWIYRMMYKIVSVFLSNRTKEKIEIISDINDLKKYFTYDNLIISHGGKSNFIYAYPS